MTQLCENCGRRFDGDLTDGICPHCGQMCSRPVEGPAPEPAPADPFPEAPTAAELLLPEEEPARPNAGWKLCGILAVCFVFSILIFFPLMKIAQAQHKDSAWLSDVSLSEPLPGDSLSIGTHGRVLHLGNAQPIEDFQGVPKGWQAVEIFCRFDRLSGDDYDFSLSYEIFLENGGIFYPPIDSYDLEDVYPELTEKRLTGSDFLDSHMKDGWFYFLIPENTETVNFWVQEQHLDERYNADRVSMTGVQLTVGGNEA